MTINSESTDSTPKINTFQSVDMSTDVSGTTTFAQESKAVKSSVITPQEKSQLYPVRDQTISDFLAKPYLVDSLTWTTAGVSTTQLYSMGIGIQLDNNPLWKEKLKGFNFIRAKAVLRVQLNTTPFHSGKLIISLDPCFSNGGSGVDPNAWRYSLGSRSQLPHVLLDCRDTTAMFEIPYVSPVDYYTLETLDAIDWGQIFITIMAPLGIGASGETEVPYNIFLHFEDVELAAPMHPQSGVFVPQAGKQRAVGKTTSDNEALIASTGGSISKALMLGSTVATAVAKVPMLEPFATPASWVMRGLSNVASWFGWSKPIIDSPVSYVSRINEPNMANSTGVSSAVTLALLNDNSVSVKPGFGGVAQDEMSFDYLKTISSYVDSTSWSTGTTSGTLLKTITVSPRMPNVRVNGTQTFNTYNPIGFLSHYFVQYRGGIELTFRFAKTDFHSGRLVFAFVPSESVTVPTLEETAYLLREVVDIRSSSEVKLKIPYLHFQKYISTTAALGKVYVYILNELRAPETCSSSIQMLMFSGGAQDFELQVPGTIETGNASVPFLPQSGVEPNVDQGIISETIGNYPDMAQTVEASFDSVGECFTSVKQLLLRYSMIKTKTATTVPAAKQLVIAPYTVQLPTISRPDPLMTFDMLSILANGYLFMRGSVNLGVVPSDSTKSIRIANQPIWFSSFVLDVGGNQTSPVYSLGQTGYDNTAPLPYQQYDSQLGVYTARFPYYCETHSTLIIQPTASVNPGNIWEPNSFAVIASGSEQTYTLFRSVGEDFHLGYFLGFPPMTSTF